MAVAAALVVAAVACEPYDFKGSLAADVVWRTNDGVWHLYGQEEPLWVGPAVPAAMAPGNYDGYGKTEPAIFAGPTWVTAGNVGTIPGPVPAFPGPAITTSFSPALVPVPADYDGDGDTDPAFYRVADATWWIQGQHGPVTFGRPLVAGCAAFDVPIPRDYDGDGDDDVAVFNPTDGAWTTLEDGVIAQTNGPGEIPVPADWDGDGDVDPATYGTGGGPAEGTWHVPGRADMEVSDGESLVPAPGDYDGDGLADPAVISMSSGEWRIASGGTTSVLATSANAAPANVPPAVLQAYVRLHFYARALAVGQTVC